MANAASVQQRGELAPIGRYAIRGAWMGFFVDMFDIYLPIIVLAPAIAYFISPEMDQATTAIVSGSIFAATLIGRPIGAAIFGHIGDTVGRKRATILALMGSGAATFLVVLLPGYELLGITIVVIFIALRLINGIFVGGVYTAANPLAMEYSPKEKRGFYGALIMTGYPLAYAAISLITLVLLQFIPAGGLDSPYVQWGWRIPFIISTLMIFSLVYYFVNSVAESQLFEAAHESEEDGGSPLIELFKGENLRSFLQVFVLMGGFWLTLYVPSAMLPPLLTSELGLSGTALTFTLVIAFLVLVGGYLAAGLISQKIGRRPFLIVASVIMATVGALLYYVLLSTTPQNLVVVIALVTAIVLLVTWVWGLATVYIIERFHIGVRASGFGLGYSLAVILPAFYAFYQAGLGNFMPFKYTPLPLLLIGSVLILIGAVWGPETKDVDFAEDAVADAPPGTESHAADGDRSEGPRRASEIDRTPGSS
jgi:MFS family permease